MTLLGKPEAFQPYVMIIISSIYYGKYIFPNHVDYFQNFCKDVIYFPELQSLSLFSSLCSFLQIAGFLYIVLVLIFISSPEDVAF